MRGKDIAEIEIPENSFKEFKKGRSIRISIPIGSVIPSRGDEFNWFCGQSRGVALVVNSKLIGVNYLCDISKISIREDI